jgi:hypothetical protein
MNMQALILVGTFALSLVVLYPMMSLAQFEPSTGEQSQEQIEVPLNFSLKVPGGDDQNATEGGKDVRVTLKIRSGEEGSPIDLLLTAEVSNDTNIQDLELCGTMQEGNEMCQSLEEVLQTLEEVVEAQGDDQTSSESSNETSTSGESTDENNDNGDN